MMTFYRQLAVTPGPCTTCPCSSSAPCQHDEKFLHDNIAAQTFPEACQAIQTRQKSPHSRVPVVVRQGEAEEHRNTDQNADNGQSDANFPPHHAGHVGLKGRGQVALWESSASWQQMETSRKVLKVEACERRKVYPSLTKF